MATDEKPTYLCHRCRGIGRRLADGVGDVRCENCDGTGRTTKCMIECPSCSGSGWSRTMFYVIECPACRSAGWVEAAP
jgi:hypothetical protein